MERSDSEKEEKEFYEKIAEETLYRFLETIWFGKVSKEKTLVLHKGKSAIVETVDSDKSKPLKINIKFGQKS